MKYLKMITRIMGKMCRFEVKIAESEKIIKEFYGIHRGMVAVSFSGGKDSVVLLHLVRSIYPEVPAVFVNTGLEFPEIVQFVKSTPNCIILRPEKSFKQVIEQYGYPLFSKEVCRFVRDIKYSKSEKIRQLRLEGSPKGNFGRLPYKYRFLLNAPFEVGNACCYHLKKAPLNKYTKETGRYFYMGIKRADSKLRQSSGRFITEDKKKCSPLLNWADEDIWQYIKENNIPYCEIYDKGETMTGCIFCGMGIQFDKGERFFRLKELHPKLYDYMMDKLGFRRVLNYVARQLDWDYWIKF